MIDRYGLAVVHERTTPRHWDGLAASLRQEYGQGTTPGYLLASDGVRGRRTGGLGSIVGRSLHRLAHGLRAASLGVRTRNDRALACDGCAAPER